MYRLQFSLGTFSVDFRIRGRISQLQGDSGEGKTYVMNKLKRYSSKLLNEDISKVYVVSTSNEARMFMQLGVENREGLLCIIDNIEVFEDNEIFLTYLKSISRKNYVLVVGRVDLPLGIQMSDILHLECNGGVWEVLPYPGYTYLLGRE